ncbi:MAG: alkaline phosphatase family protein [Planctomycetes bacterium]|nr:alkaline phosphatase family protein [Planctomycetota bacterium]MCW8137145.1 alkaline phosphatase family protein [Planctomycetota bacterium]
MRNVCILLILAVASAPLAAEDKPKAVVLGIDALDQRLMEQYMAEGHLPNLQKLAEQGHYSALETSYPPMSPTAWSTMVTGLNPGKTGIFGFLRRKQGTYDPEIALADVNEQPLLPGRTPGRVGLALIAGGLLFAAGLVLGKVLQLVLRGREVSNVFAGLCVIIMVLLTPVPGVVESLGHALGALAAMGVCAAAFGYFVFRNKLKPGTFIFPALVLVVGAYMALSWIPETLPAPVSARGGTTFWKMADQHGLRARVIGAPVNWPAREDLEFTRTTTGLATPDAMGTYHTYTLFTEPHHELAGGITEMSGRVERLEFKDDVARAKLLGPPDKFNTPRWKEWEEGRLERMPRMELPFTVTRTERGARIDLEQRVAVEGATHELAVGEWKRHIRVVYDLGGVARLHGTVSFKLLAGPQQMRLYATPVQFDPLEPNNRFAISEPLTFAPWLAREFGMYQTMGWAEATSALNDGIIEDETFLETCVQSFDEKRAQILGLLDTPADWDLLVAFTYEVDRVCHMMWRHMDTAHPNHDPTAPAHWRTAIRDFYVRYDKLVGEVLAKLPVGALLIVCSDHGFAPFYRAVNVNRWLADNGYLVLKRETGQVGMDGMFNTKGGYYDPYDWSKTRAYALGLNQIYINLKGREPEGIVEESEAEALKDEIIGKLKNLRDDEAHGFAPVFSGVWKREQIWEGDRLGEAGDLQLGYAWGYRVSWQTSLGGASEPVVFDNLKNWSGDHCSFDPKLVPGVVFSNRKLDAPAYRLWDAGLTAIDWLGVPMPQGRGKFDGEPWKVR